MKGANSILLDGSEACTAVAIAIRGVGRVGVWVRKWNGSSEEGEKVSLRGSLRTRSTP